MKTGATQSPCVLIVAAGSGGHVIPGLEIGRELRARGWDCVFVGTPRGFENRLVPGAGFELLHVSIGSFNRVPAARRVSTLVAAPAALAAALRIVQQRRPAAVLSCGGSAAGPVVAACALLDVPLVVMEPNAFPGLSNRLAAPVACTVLLGHSGAAAFFRASTCRVTGVPVRREFFQSVPKAPSEPLTLLILGGSQGAARLNRAAVEAARIWTADGCRPPSIIHQTGERDHVAVEAAYRDLGVEADTAPFFDDLAQRIATADLVVCRAGASAVAELCAARKPAVLVPFPYAADDHQRANGTAVAAAGGALVVEDADWNGARMVRELSRFASAPERLAAMASALAPLAPVAAAKDAADAVADAAHFEGWEN